MVECTALQFPKAEASGEGSLPSDTPPRGQDVVPSTHSHMRLENVLCSFPALAVALVCVNMQLLHSFCHLDQKLALWVICSVQVVQVVWG